MKVLVFCRYPELGKVKTRIAKDCGDAGALAIYEKLLKVTFENLKESGFPFEVHHTGGEQVEVDFWLQELEGKSQVEGSLGDRLKYAVKDWFSVQNDSIAIIGSDQPDIGKALLQETEEQLKKHDVVIGPAEDGGYYLIAINGPYLNLFEDISWGTDKVFYETLEKLNELALSYKLLPLKNDVDYLDDVPDEWKKELMLHENRN